MSLWLAILKPLPDVANMSLAERLLSGTAGAAFLYLSVRDARRRAFGYAFLGSALLLRAITGRTRFHEAEDFSLSEGDGREPEVRHSPPYRQTAEQDGIRVERTFYVHRPATDVYRAWRNLENLPHFIRHLERVDVKSPRRSRWVAKTPSGHRVEWESEIVEERTKEILSWRSMPGADLNHTGSVTFRELDDGTELHLVLEYQPSSEKLGIPPAMLFVEEPGRQIDADLLLFKHLMEVGG